MKLAFSALLFALAVASTLDADAKCMHTEAVPLVLTAANAKLPAGGGIVVGWENSTDFAEAGSGDPSSRPSWTAESKGKDVALTLTALAPGLTVYTPTKPLTGPLALHDAKAVRVTVDVSAAKATPLAAPKVKSLTVSVSDHRRWSDTEADAAVESVPDGAIALVVTTTGADAHAITYGRPAHDKTGATTVAVYASGGHCGGGLPPGTTEPAAGEKVTLAWVDAAGRLSPQSAPVVVSAKKP